jgi:diketogulonate reductase-like aldo/keto reductase
VPSHSPPLVASALVANTGHATTARIKSNLAVKRLSDEDMATLNAMEVPSGKGRTVDYNEKWGVKLFSN